MARCLAAVTVGALLGTLLFFAGAYAVFFLGITRQ